MRFKPFTRPTPVKLAPFAERQDRSAEWKGLRYFMSFSRLIRLIAAPVCQFVLLSSLSLSQTPTPQTPPPQRPPNPFENVPQAPAEPAPAAPTTPAPQTPQPGAPQAAPQAQPAQPAVHPQDIIYDIEFRGARRVPQETL